MATKTITDIFYIAFKLHTLGYSVIPSGGGDKGKAPIVSWIEFQDRQPTDEELQTWQDKERPGLWGIVTGKLSGVVVIDADNDQARDLLEDHHLAPHILTPRGGAHYYFNYPGYPVKTCAGLLPSIDIRGDGGFVNAIGGKYQIVILPEPCHVYPWEDLPAPIINALRNGKTTTLSTESQVIPEGQRNAVLASLAGTMRRRGMSQEAIEGALLTENNRCQPPLPENEVKAIANSVARYAPNTGINKNTCIYSLSDIDLAMESHKKVTEKVTESEALAKRIRDWVTDTSGWFSYDEIDREFEIRSPTEKHNRWMIIKRLKDDDILESHLRHNKLLRYIKVATRLVDFKVVGQRTPLAIKYPFGIESYFQTYPGNVIAIAGAADAGKTAFLLNLIRLNMADFSIYYQTSEMGAEELANRLTKFKGIVLDEWNFIAEDRSRDLADVIRPDCINIVDYLELAGDFYMVADYLKAIHDKLSSGIAIVALQKRRGAELGRGGDFGLEKPRLYLSMDAGKLTIQKAKNWVNPQVNPNGLVLNFKIVNGCKFTVTDNWHKVE